MSPSDPKPDGKPSPRSDSLAPAIERDIVERMKSETALRESNEQLETLWNGMAAGAALHEMVRDAAGRAGNYRLVKVNPQYQDIVGLSAEEVIGKLATEVYGAPVAPYLEEYSAVVRSGKPSAMEVYFAPLGKHFHISVAPWGKDGFATIFTDITERKRTEDALKESVTNFHTFFESMADMIFVGTPEGRVLFTNTAATKTLGYSAEELSVMHMLDLHPKDRRQEAEAIFGAMFKGEQNCCPLPLARKDGSLVPVETRAWQGRWDGVDCIFGISKDLTAEQEAQQRFERIFNNNPAPMALSASSGRQFIDVNNAFLKALGYGKDELIGKTSAELGIFLRPEQVEKIENSLRSDGHIAGLELQVRCKNGEILDGLFSGEMINNQGRQYFLTVMINVTESRKAARELAESKALIEAVVENVPLMIFLKEASDLRFVLFNRAGEDLLGHDRKDLLGKSDLDLFPPEQAAHFMAKDQEVLNGKTGLLDIPEEPILTAKKGQRLLHTQKVSIHGADGATKYLLGISEDITERKKSESTLANLQKLQSLGTLAGGIAHDFNNILTGIMGNLSLLQSEVKSGREALEMIKEAQEACGTAKNLSHQLLTFAKGGSPIITAQDLRPLLKQATSFALRGSNVRCVFDFGEGPLAVKVDKEQVSQVIQNLVINATQAMPEGGDITIKSHIVILGEKEIPPLAAGRYVRVTVSDQGEGIAAAHLPKIFDPYFSTKAQGRGLGLSVCYSIMAKHGGLISVDSKPGAGAVFTILFPAADAADIPAEQEPAAITTGSGRVLVMDDDAQVTRVLTRMLKNLGYQPDAVADGQAACDAYKKAMKAGQPYAAVILDLTIPGGMGGKEAMVKLQAIDPKAKALVSSGYSEDPIISEYAAHGFSGVLAKPYVVNEVSDALRRIIGSQTG